MIKVDAFDLKILRYLIDDGRITKSKLAEKINLSLAACSDRVKRLETAGVIQGYHAQIDVNQLRPLIHVYVEVTLSRHGSEDLKAFENIIKSKQEVTQCVATGGGVDYLFMVQAETIQRYQEFIDELLDECEYIEKYFTYIVTKWIKNDSLNRSFIQHDY